MIPKHLVNLACQEFPTYRHALKASPSGTERIVWTEPIDDYIIRPNVTPDEVYEIRRRTMSLHQLPSGFWAWIPDHPNDLSVVAEHKLQNNKQFGETQILIVEVVKHPWDEEMFLERYIEHAKKDLGIKFLQTVEEGKIYRTSYVRKEGKELYCGTSLKKVTLALMYAEEVYSEKQEL